MSVGHIAREIEAAGVPTVAVFVRSFRHVAEAMGVPRVVSTPHPMGRPMGAPGDAKRHTEVVRAAFDLLATAQAGGTIVDMQHAFRPGSKSPG